MRASRLFLEALFEAVDDAAAAYWLSCLRARSLFSPTLSLDHSQSLSLTHSLALSPSSPPPLTYTWSPLHKVSSLVYYRTRKTLFWDTLDVRVTKSFYFTAYLRYKGTRVTGTDGGMSDRSTIKYLG